MVDVSATIAQMAKMLGVLSCLLDKAEAHANAHGLSEEEVLGASLATDMFSLTKQLQAAADNAKFAATRLAQIEPPKDPDDEATFAELRDRLVRTKTFLEGFGPEDFDDPSTVRIILPFAETMYAPGDEYLTQFAEPNFYFHTVTAYGILRNLGVDIGKRDYLGKVPLRPITP
ncbi:MAG: DUF1993 domain-containing protein [Myxococcota bacterium]